MKCYILQNNVKGMTSMNSLYKYIDLCVIDEFAKPDSQNLYSLDVDELPDYQKFDLLTEIIKEDTDLRDIVSFHMQKLIDQRLQEKNVTNLRSI